MKSAVLLCYVSSVVFAPPELSNNATLFVSLRDDIVARQVTLALVFDEVHLFIDSLGVCSRLLFRRLSCQMFFAICSTSHLPVLVIYRLKSRCTHYSLAFHHAERTQLEASNVQIPTDTRKYLFLFIFTQ